MFGWFSGPPRQGGDGQNVLADGRSVELALYKYDSCPFCVRVFRALDRLEVNVEYRDIRSEPSWRADLRDKTGRHTVPCLFIDGEPMFESLDIVAWLKEHFPERDG